MSSETDRTPGAADNALGQNTLGDLRPSDLIESATALARRAISQPAALAKATLGFWGELASIAAGEKRLEPEPGDRRFSDEAWKSNAFYAGVLQSYLAARRSLKRFATISSDDERQAERAEFLLAQLGDAFAPSNFLLGNPAALRKFMETGGMSLVRGTRNFLDDVAERRPIPAQVDYGAFEVGRNLAVTPGSVVLRTEMFELIQYAAQTPQVYERPIVVVPSIVNKYYVFDLAPGRSIIEFFVQQGFTMFVVVWRNPKPQHDAWGMPAYEDAVDTAIDAARAVCKTGDVNVWAVCGAGPVVASLAGYYGAVWERKINSILFVVSPLDMRSMSEAPGIGAYVDQIGAGPAAAKKNKPGKRISAKEFTLLFAMLRANDLIWNYWVSNYLMGETPSAFDVLYWNGDGTGMTAQFNADFSDFIDENPFVTPGKKVVRGTPIADLSKLDIDTYVLGAKNDHLCVWQGVYRSALLFGERSQFVLGNSGHIQTIVSPPGNPKASFSVNDLLPPSPADWLAGATQHPGSWWDHGVAWTAARSGESVPAPETMGNTEYPPLGAAPGSYVHERG
jgi:polyhydroxyalkanoate synthase